MGNHDSELAIVMEDYQVLESKMDGQPYKAGHHAATLRRLLWREHLGLIPAQAVDASEDPNAQPPDVCPNDVLEGKEYDFVADPLSDEVWNLWTGQATTNTEIFRHLFRADPDDHSKQATTTQSVECWTLKKNMLIMNRSQKLPRLRDLPPQKRHQARAPPRSVHANRRGEAEARSDQGSSSLDAVGLPEGCGDGGVGNAGQCVYGEHLHLSVVSA